MGLARSSVIGAGRTERAVTRLVWWRGRVKLDGRLIAELRCAAPRGRRHGHRGDADEFSENGPAPQEQITQLLERRVRHGLGEDFR